MTPSQTIGNLPVRVQTGAAHAIRLYVARHWHLLAGLVLFHVAAGILMRRSSSVATVMVGASLLAAMSLALMVRRPVHILCIAGYVAGSEVLWRMTRAGFPYETGKLAVMVILVIGLFRMKKPKAPMNAIGFILLLIPGAVISYSRWTWEGFIDAISFNLAGPMVLGVAVWFCSNVRITKKQLMNLMVCCMLPVLAVAGISVSRTITAGAAMFQNVESNFAASGGFGPNQVSSTLSYGAIMAGLYLLISEMGGIRLLIIAGSLGACLYQALLTMSRAGPVTATGAIAAAALFLLFDQNARRRVLVILVPAVLLAVFVLLPQMNDMTGGALEARFSDDFTDDTRSILMQQDLHAFSESPVFGVGVGISKFYHYGYVAAHTEYTRLIAEHGIFGILALAILLFSGFSRILSLRWTLEGAWVAAMFVWVGLYMGVNAMRTVAPALLYGMAFLTMRDIPAEADDEFVI